MFSSGGRLELLNALALSNRSNTCSRGPLPIIVFLPRPSLVTLASGPTIYKEPGNIGECGLESRLKSSPCDEAKRLMDNDKLAGTAEARTLGRRVALVEACQKLAQLPDFISMPADERLSHYQLISANDVVPNDRIKVKVLLAKLAELDISGTQQDRRRFLDLLLPFHVDADPSWDWMNPRLCNIVAQALERSQPARSSAWDIDLDEEDCAAPQTAKDPEEPVDWEASLKCSPAVVRRLNRITTCRSVVVITQLELLLNPRSLQKLTILESGNLGVSNSKALRLPKAYG